MYKKPINKFFKLSNGQFLKIMFSYKSSMNSWFMSICVANTKRQCNDCMRKTENSPKVLYGKITGKKLGTEALLIAKNELLKFETMINSTNIHIMSTSDRLAQIYKYLKRYGYKEKRIAGKSIMYKTIN